jgi:hypothetical protein
MNLTFDTIVNMTTGTSNTNSAAAPSDALFAFAVPVTISNSILRAQPSTAPITNGADIDAQTDTTPMPNVGATIDASASSFTATDTATGSTVTAVGTNGNIPGDPGFNDAAGGDFSLAPGAALIGAGDPTAVQGGELDVTGAARDSACTGTPSAVVNIGAYESAAPQCPAPPAAGNSTGKLAQLTGAGNCISGDTAANSGCNTAGVAGLSGGTATNPSPNDVVQSPDGRNVYTVGEDPSGNGVDIAEFSRGSSGLAQLPAPDNCISSGTSAVSGCGTDDVAELDYALNAITSQPSPQPARIAVSPDGKNVYVDNGPIVSEFARDTSTGALTPIGASACIEQTNDDATCSVQNETYIGAAAALVVSPDGEGVYLATLNQCFRATFRHKDAADSQNANCNNNRPNNSAEADIAVFNRDPSTGLLSPSTPACYANTTNAPTGATACSTGFDGLYSMTSLAFSPDGNQAYVTSDSGANPGPLVADPGEITELTRDPSTNALTAITGAGACVTAGTGCGGADAGTNGVAGVIEPQQIVLSPDGANAYVVSAQYTGGSTGVNTGALVSSTLTQFARDPGTGALTPLSGATCFTGWNEACESDTGPIAGIEQLPGLTGAEGLAISADGQSVYVSAQSSSHTGIVEFSRDTGSGLLAPLSSPDTCLSSGTPPGGTGQLDCGTTSLAGLSATIAPLPGGVLVSADCTGAYLAGDGVAEFSRVVPASSSGCASPSGGSTVSLSTNGLSFGVVTPLEVGTTSAPQTVTVTNAGSSGLTIGPDGVTITGTGAASFAKTADSCSGETIPSQRSCSITLTFKPAVEGVVGAQLEIADDAVGSPQDVTLTGDGSAAHVTPSPTSLGFGTSGGQIAVGSSSVHTVTITNPGRVALRLTKAAIGGAQPAPFAITADSCTGQLVAPNGGQCALSVTFGPTASGTSGAQLILTDNALDSPQAIPLTGVAGVPAASLSTHSIAFADNDVDHPQSATVTDTGPALLTFGAVTLTGPEASSFEIDFESCSGQTIAPGASCSLTVSFAPKASGASTAELQIPDNAPGSTQTISVSGSATLGSITGHVRDGRGGSNGPELQGADVNACRLPALSTCSYATTDRQGSYTVPALAPDSYIVTVWTSTDTFYTSSAEVTVGPGQAAVHDFALTAPIALSGGVTFSGTVTSSGRSGTVGAGQVPRVFYKAPFSVNAPLSIPMTQPPRTTRLFNEIEGVGANAATEEGQGLYQATDVMFAVHYGNDGRPVAMSSPLQGTVDCGPPSPASPCAGLAAEAGVDTGAGPGTARDALGRRATDPIASSASDCPPTKPIGWDLEPNDTGGVNMVYNYPDGTQDVFILNQVAIPPMPANGNLAHDFFFATVIGGANLAINTLNPFIGWYNTALGLANSVSTAAHSNSADVHVLEDGNASLTLLTNFGGDLHGPFSWFVNGASAVLGTEANQLTHSQSKVQLEATPDCPPKHGDGYSDPSGVVVAQHGIPVAGSTVTLSRADKAKQKPTRVLNGSATMSPANRRNPDFTSLLGAFGWDTLPGFYQVRATKPGCRPAHGRGTAALTSLFPVPPPVSNLVLTLRCRHLERTATRTQLREFKGTAGTVLLLATVRGGRLRSRELLGTVMFAAGGKRLGGGSVNAATGTAVYVAPATPHPSAAYSASYGGNGVAAPSKGRARR